jgi:two-component system, NarL family, nitrate/nitrite response regulator NarL
MENSIRILLVDDHKMILTALGLLIESHDGFLVVGKASSKTEALEIAIREQPDIIVLDLAMGHENGLDYIREFNVVARSARIIVLTGINEPKLHQQAVQLGAMGLVEKATASEVLLMAIRKVHQGEAWIDRLTMGTLLSEINRTGKKEQAADPAEKINLITKREREIINLVAKGFKNKQIADRLHLSDITVRHHLTSIFSKLGVTDRFELIVFAYSHSLCDLPKQEERSAGMYSGARAVKADLC